MDDPAAQSGRGAGVIQGNVKSADGAAMEGVIVSARAADKSFTTSVFTDRQGNYVFPSLDAGQYKVWAQAVGFEAGRAEFALAGARADRNFTLTPNRDPSRTVKQMSGVEYLQNLPQSTAADRRMVHAFKNNCTGCHTASYALQNRWDAHGWGILVDLMTVFPSSGVPVPGHAADGRAAGQQDDRRLPGRAVRVPRSRARSDGAEQPQAVAASDRRSHAGGDHGVRSAAYRLVRSTSTTAATGRWARRRASSVARRTTSGWMPPASCGWPTTWCPSGRSPSWTRPPERSPTMPSRVRTASRSARTASSSITSGKVWATGEDGNFAMLDSRTGETEEFPAPGGDEAGGGWNARRRLEG